MNRLALVTSLCLVLPAGAAQAQICNNLMSTAASGDNNPSLTIPVGVMNDIVDNYGADVDCEWLGESECFDNEPGGSNLTDVDGSLRRFVNGVVLADQIPFFGQSNTWEDIVHDNVAWVEPHPECDPFMSAWGAAGTCHIDVSRRSLRNREIYLRAAAFLHENRHCHLNDLHGGECPAGPGGCDHAYSDEGAYQWTVEPLAQFASFAPAQWNSFQRADAVKMANGILSFNFEVHPGFHYVLGGNGLSRKWTFTDMSFESLAPDPADREVITRVDLHVVPSIVGGLFAPGVQGIRVWRSTVAPDGTLSGNTATEVGDMGLDPSQIATADASLFGPNHAMVGLRIGWGALPTSASGTNGLAFGQRAGFLVVGAEIGPDGDLINTQVASQGGGSAAGGCAACSAGQVCMAGTCEQVATDPNAAVLVAAPGEVLTGFGLSSSASSTNWGPATGSSRLPPPFLPYRGGGEGEWTRELVSCPADTTAVGVIAARSGDENNAAFVGTMALLCQPDAELTAGESTGPTLVAVHPTFETDAGVTPAGSLTGWAVLGLIADLTGHNPVTATCPPGRALIGIEGRSGSLIDRVGSLRCRSVGAPGENSVSVDVGVGGGAPFSDRCLASDRVDGFVTRRDGQRLRGIALHCGDSP